MRKVLLLIVMCIALAGTTLAQITVTGTVTSQTDGLGLPGVTVVEKGTSNGTITNADGNFTLKVASAQSTLVFSFIGMKTVEVAVNNQTSVSVSMTSEDIGIDEVVVTALGISRDKKSLGYAVSEVSGETMSTVKELNMVN